VVNPVTQGDVDDYFKAGRSFGRLDNINFADFRPAAAAAAAAAAAPSPEPIGTSASPNLTAAEALARYRHARNQLSEARAAEAAIDLDKKRADQAIAEHAALVELRDEVTARIKKERGQAFRDGRAPDLSDDEEVSDAVQKQIAEAAPKAEAAGDALPSILQDQQAAAAKVASAAETVVRWQGEWAYAQQTLAEERFRESLEAVAVPLTELLALEKLAPSDHRVRSGGRLLNQLRERLGGWRDLPIDFLRGRSTSYLPGLDDAYSKLVQEMDRGGDDEP
jgi:hypothetical protein